MRNDEKIDIQLDDVSDEDLSAEEIAQQHYNTALRYINIAEHMKQFEDQDKYYHRAIKYLRLAQPYIKVRPLLRELRKKKFTARAEGKIALYEEACRIRDRAKTPNDFYSAQTVFDRIHRHELTHRIPEKRVSPELYSRLCECADSEQQAIECGQKAEQKAAEQKRHSLFVSICFIAVIVALLAFSRTIAFRQCLGTIASITGDHQTAWHSYQRIYDKTGDTSAFEKYKEHRYKAAVKAQNGQDYETAYADFYALSKENYKDSEDHLLALEQKNIENTELGEIVKFANMNWRILEKQDNKALLIKDDAISDIPFQKEDTPCTWETSYMRTWLNSTFLDENFCESEIAALPETTIITKENPTYQTPGGNNTKDQVFLLSIQEVEKYHDVLHDTKTCWWLRTPGAEKGSMSFVYKDRTIMDYGYTGNSDTFTVKPVIWVNLK